MRREPRFGAKRRDQDSTHDPMHSLKEEFFKLMKKLSDQERTIKSLKLSNAIQKQKLAELGDGAGAVTVTKKRVCQNREALVVSHLENMMSGL